MICQAITATGELCKNPAQKGSKTCHIQKHADQFKSKKKYSGGG
jgi:hypothetical protein